MPTALVTGGAVRLGRSIALHLAGRGYNIALHYGVQGKPPSKQPKKRESLGFNVKHTVLISPTSTLFPC